MPLRGNGGRRSNNHGGLVVPMIMVRPMAIILRHPIIKKGHAHPKMSVKQVHIGEIPGLGAILLHALVTWSTQESCHLILSHASLELVDCTLSLPYSAT